MMRFGLHALMTEIVRLLLDLPLERGLNPDNNDARRLACVNGYTEIVRLLLDLERGVAAEGNPVCKPKRTYGLRNSSICR